MSLPNPAPGDSVAADDIDQIRNHLEGGSGKTAPYKLRQSSGDMIVVLADNAGASEFSIHDSDDVEVAHIDSNGNATFLTTTYTNFDLPVAASPSQTAEGRVVWDSDDDKLTIGDGSSRKTFYPGPVTGWVMVGSNTTEQTTTAVADTDMVTVTLNGAVTVTQGVPLMIVVNYRKTAGAAAIAYLGLKLNSTVVLTTGSAASSLGITSAVSQAEDGLTTYWIGPRQTNYLNSAHGFTSTRVSATGAAGTAGTFVGTTLAANLPTATITSVVIRGNATNAAQTLAVRDVYVYAMGTTSV